MDIGSSSYPGEELGIPEHTGDLLGRQEVFSKVDEKAGHFPGETAAQQTKLPDDT